MPLYVTTSAAAAAGAFAGLSFEEISETIAN
jgi:hypothetical protein